MEYKDQIVADVVKEVVSVTTSSGVGPYGRTGGILTKALGFILTKSGFRIKAK